MGLPHRVVWTEEGEGLEVNDPSRKSGSALLDCVTVGTLRTFS